MQWPM